MAAEGLPPGGPPSALPGWELEAWYQDLEEVLAAEPGGTPLPWGAEQAPWGSAGGTGGCELDAALAAELLELQEAPEGSARSGVPPAAAEEEEDEGVAGCRTKRRRCGGPVASKEVAKRRQQANEQRVQELTAQNARLREEIGRLSAEVQRTRAALIERIVNLRCPAATGQPGTWGACPPGTD
ncbi:DNA damage-inducible transcript 3 protein [Phaenicophaeus curvirostris]|uniref:DNA damage-inducible transcript 3 protein n=1 Tax=Phaenicophaeus curvirostris TaxID=33595 RepID=UPI0037F09D65